VFVAMIWIAVYLQPKATTSTITTAPPEFKNVLTTAQQSAFDALSALSTLQNHPQDPESLRTLATFYYDQYAALSQIDPATALSAAQLAIRYSDRYLAVAPQDNDARVDDAVLYFYTGQTDKAIQLVSAVLKKDKHHVKGNYNLGVFLWQSPRRDYAGAAAQFKMVMALTQNDPHQQTIYQNAAGSLAEVKKEAAAAGRPIETTGTPQTGAS
jgi:tetratricopeptide (TPR) repeat protein